MGDEIEAKRRELAAIVGDGSDIRCHKTRRSSGRHLSRHLYQGHDIGLRLKELMVPIDNSVVTVHTVLAEAGIEPLLATGSAVVLERLAWGAGATNWYYCEGAAKLVVLESAFSPGSVVTFYFDDRIKRSLPNTETIAAIKQIIAQTGDAIVGELSADGVTIDVELVVSSEDLAEFLASKTSTSHLFSGAFPARDNDGVNAVTITIPDADGVVRRHPH